MKLAELSSGQLKGLSWGGSEELWSAAANRALDDSHAVALCIFDWQPPARQVVALLDRGAKFIPIPLRRPKISLFGPRHPWLRDLAAFAPDVVCVSQGQEYDLAGRRWGPELAAWLRSSSIPAASIVQYNDDAARPSSRAARLARDFIQFVRLNAYVASPKLSSRPNVRPRHHDPERRDPAEIPTWNLATVFLPFRGRRSPARTI